MSNIINIGGGAGGGGDASKRELTWLEYEALSEAEKNNGTMYFCTDANGDGSEFQPVIYSEEEREIGVWLDGKPLYEKTVNTGALPNSTTKTVAHGVSDIGTIIDIRGYAYNSTIYIPLEFSNVAGIQYGTTVYVEDTNIILSTTSDRSSFAESYITLRYTKTTDQAGSGTWTPQGVPSHHYSTDEQVVGTWTDGKTLYEKTVNFTTASSSGYIQQDLGLLSSDIDTIFIQNGFVVKGDNIATWGAYASSVNPEQCVGFLYRNSTNISFDYRIGSSYYSGSASITVRYTKTST